MHGIMIQHFTLFCIFFATPTAAKQEFQECVYDGIRYGWGDRIITNNWCEVCECHDNWDPQYPNCAKIDCPLDSYHSPDDCQPTYEKYECCPSYSHCNAGSSMKIDIKQFLMNICVLLIVCKFVKECV
ncbi:hypothetical protein GQR58_024105 [Nymphon striatum]|nr:hypothetical protein GQR58_024105 [Nymphon striatum]